MISYQIVSSYSAKAELLGLFQVIINSWNAADHKFKFNLLDSDFAVILCSASIIIFITSWDMCLLLSFSNFLSRNFERLLAVQHQHQQRRGLKVVTKCRTYHGQIFLPSNLIFTLALNYMKIHSSLIAPKHNNTLLICSSCTILETHWVKYF